MLLPDIMESKGQGESIALWETVFQAVCSGYVLRNLANITDLPEYSIRMIYTEHSIYTACYRNYTRFMVVCNSEHFYTASEQQLHRL